MTEVNTWEQNRFMSRSHLPVPDDCKLPLFGSIWHLGCQSKTDIRNIIVDSNYSQGTALVTHSLCQLSPQRSLFFARRVVNISILRPNDEAQ